MKKQYIVDYGCTCCRLRHPTDKVPQRRASKRRANQKWKKDLRKGYLE